MNNKINFTFQVLTSRFFESASYTENGQKYLLFIVGHNQKGGIFLSNKETGNMPLFFLKVKELTKQLYKGSKKIEELEYLPGRGKGWMFKGRRVSIHCLEAHLVYYLFFKK